MRINPRSEGVRALVRELNLKVKVTHFYGDRLHTLPFNATVYATLCQVFDRTTGALVAEDWAKCNPKDAPCRKRGYDIAVGRALKDAFIRCGVMQKALPF